MQNGKVLVLGLVLLGGAAAPPASAQSLVLGGTAALPADTQSLAPGGTAAPPADAPSLVLGGAAALPASAQSLAPGGFVESATSTDARPRIFPKLPWRGKFSFPAPYGTVGVRVTNRSDCGGADCVQYVGYSYWRNSNNHVGSGTMLLMVTLDRNRGGGGPTLFSYDKASDKVTKVGPLFDASSALSWSTGEGWYWSATRQNALYLNDGARMRRYDVVTRQFETVFDAREEFGADRAIWQMHSSDDDRVHSATLKSSVTWESLGCLVYREDRGAFSLFPRIGEFDECQIDRSGRWLVIKENVDGVHGEDNRIIDIDGRRGERLFLDQEGAAGHSDAGVGYMVAEDNWHSLPGAVRLWKFAKALPGALPQGRLVYRTTDWASSIGHISHTNARAGLPPAQQYACGGGVSRSNPPRANEIVCFRLDGSLDVLVVAPVMTDLDKRGGGSDYAKRPKGNLDVTGQYFIWTGNAGTNRLDAFVVRVPSHLLAGPATPGQGEPETFTDAFDRPNSTALGDAWREVRGDLRIRNGRLSHTGSGRHLAVVPGLVGPVQTVAADFTSTDTTVNPTFGVVLRYQNPRNYYLVYRRAGGTSALRVAKVVNGVETVLGEAAVENPPLRTPFRIEGRADGTTLTFTLDGVTRLTAVDSTFDSGSPGIRLTDGGSDASQRADAFSATVE